MRLLVVPLVVEPHELLFALHALIRFVGRMAGHEMPVQVVFEIETLRAHGTRERLVAVVVPELVHLELLVLAEPFAAQAAPVRFLAAVEPLVVLRLVTLVREVFVAQLARDARRLPQLFRARRRRQQFQFHGTAAVADGRPVVVVVVIAVRRRRPTGRRQLLLLLLHVLLLMKMLLVVVVLLLRQRHRRRWRRRRRRRYGRHYQQAGVLVVVVMVVMMVVRVQVMIDARVRTGHRSVVGVAVFRRGSRVHVGRLLFDVRQLLLELLLFVIVLLLLL